MRAHSIPNLYIAGVEKAGTSFLYDLLAQHPQIFAPDEKEPRSFLEGVSNDRVKVDWSEYLDLFHEQDEFRYRIDGSPFYFYYDEAMRRISAETDGNAKILVVLRDPIGRAYSHYQMMFSNGGVPRLSFSELFSRSTDKSHSFYETAESYRHVFTRSLYHKRLETAYKTFSKEQVLCLVFEDLKTDWNKGCDRIFDFLELEKCAVDLSLSRRNAGYGVKGFFGRSLVSWAQSCGRSWKPVIPINMYDRMKNGVMRSGELLSKIEPTPELGDWDRLDEMKSYYADDVEKLSAVLGMRPNWLEQTA